MSIRALIVITSMMALTTLAQAHPPERGMGMTMGQGDSGGMGMMGGSMMDMMMGRESSMGMMGRSGMMGECTMDGSVMGMGLGRVLQVPDLSDEQRETVTSRHRELQRQQLRLQEKALDARFALQDAAAEDMPDPEAVGRALQGVFDVCRQMVEATVAAHNDVRNALTEEQLEALTSHGPGMDMSGMRGRMMQRQ